MASVAAPAEKTVNNLNGVWIMNKVESDPTDPILKLQGIGWFIRKVIAAKTITLQITQTKEEDGTDSIIVVQPGVAGLNGTEEKRHIPPNNEIEWNDHTDHIFGHVKGYTQWIKLSQLSDEDEDEHFLKQGWEEGPEVFIDSYVENQDNGWTARQIWGFAEHVPKAGGDKIRRYTRRVVVKNDSDTKRSQLVYDYAGEL